MATIDQINAVDPVAELISQLEAAVALARSTGQALSLDTIGLMVNAAKAGLKTVSAQAPTHAAGDMFVGGIGIDAISANSSIDDRQKSSLRQLLSRHGLAVPPAGQALSHSYVNERLAGLSAQQRLVVKTQLVENNLYIIIRKILTGHSDAENCLGRLR